MALVTHPAIAPLHQSDYETAATLCEQAIVTAPNNATNYWYLGLCRLLQGDEAEAQAVWFTALTWIDPAIGQAEMQTLQHILGTEGDRQLAQNHAQLAELIYRQVLDLDAEQPIIYLQLGNALCLQGKLEAAIDSWKTATQLQPDLVEAYIQQAEVWQRLEQWDTAIAAYQPAIERQPTAELRYQLAICLGQQQQWTAALEQLHQVLVAKPDFAPGYSDRGWLYLQLNQWTNATQAFQAALQLHSNYAQRYNQWVAQLQQANLPVSQQVQQNAAQLNELCVAAERVWQQWVTPPAIAPSGLAPIGETPPPTGYFLETQVWTQAQPSAQYIAVDRGSVIALQPPKTCDRSLHFSFRLAPEILLPETFVVTIPNGRCWLNAVQSSSAILTATNELLGDLSPEFPLLTPGHPDKHPANHSIFNTPLPTAQVIDGTVAVLAGLTSDMYFHWMFDILPRFDLLSRSGIDLTSIDYFLIDDHLPFQQETLSRLGIPQSKVLSPAKSVHFQATQLIVPSYPGSPAWMPQRVCQWLQTLMLGTEAKGLRKRDRLYITRQKTTNRRIINESELIDWLQKWGFQVVALESLSVQAQANLLASASVVISAHGGGLTNLTFCQPATKVIEIFPSQFVYPCYWLISNHLNLDYYYITGSTPEGYFLHQQLYPNPRLEDILLDMEQLKHTLRLAEVML